MPFEIVLAQIWTPLVVFISENDNRYTIKPTQKAWI